MGSRVPLALGILAFALYLPAAALATTTTVVPGTPAYDNIQNALKFMREHGSGAAADEIQKRLDEGKVSVNDELDMNTNGETSNVSGSIELNPDVAFPNRALNPVSNFTQIIELARTLFHENIHSNHQGYFYAWAVGSKAQEHYAYSYTILEMEKWIRAEWSQHFDLWGRPRTPMAPIDHARELDHIVRKIGVLTAYTKVYALNDYFGYDDKDWADGINQYWIHERDTYIQPELDKLDPTNTSPTPQTTPGGGTAATPPTPQSKPEPPHAEPPPEPPPVPEPPPCDPCKGIAAQIQALKGELTQLGQQAKTAQDAAEQAQRNVDNLNKKADGIERELNRAAGTGGSSYDPTTGVTIDAYDQGNGTVKVTTRDRNGNVTDEYVRDSSKRKAELADQLKQTRAEITRAEAEAKQLADLAAQAGAAVEEAARRLDDLVRQLEDCIKKYCQTLSTGEALNMLGLPYPDLDTLADPTSFNTIGGDRDAPVQVMIVEIHVGGQPGLTVPGQARPASRGWWQDHRQPRTGVAALLAWLRPTPRAWMAGGHRWSADHRRPWSIDDSAAGQAGRRAPAVPPVQMLLTSLGQSMGQAFDLQVFNNSGRPLRLGANALVVEPLKSEAKRQVQGVVQRLSRTAAPVTAKLNGYCLEFLKLPPSAGTIFKVAAPELQQRFAPMRNIMDASRRVQQLGQLRPDSEPNGYFHSIRQWAMWTVEQKFNDRSFADAFVEHTRKAVVAAKRPWNGEAEKVVRSAAPNRWADIQKILSAASQLAPAR